MRNNLYENKEQYRFTMILFQRVLTKNTQWKMGDKKQQQLYFSFLQGRKISVCEF